MDQPSNTKIQNQRNKEGGDEVEMIDEDIQPNINNITRSGDLSPRSTMDLKKDKRKSRPTGFKGSQIQIRSTSAKATGSK